VGHRGLERGNGGGADRWAALPIGERNVLRRLFGAAARASLPDWEADARS
jgi:hypothetical protein